MRYHTSGPDRWSRPKQNRYTDWGGHGPIRSLLDDRPDGEPHPLVGVMILSGFAMLFAIVWVMT